MASKSDSAGAALRVDAGDEDDLIGPVTQFCAQVVGQQVDATKPLKVEDTYPAGYEILADVVEHLTRFIEQIYNAKLHRSPGTDVTTLGV